MTVFWRIGTGFELNSCSLNFTFSWWIRRFTAIKGVELVCIYSGRATDNEGINLVYNYSILLVNIILPRAERCNNWLDG